MTTQPPSRTQFYLDKRNGKVIGVCSGIADYTGFDVTLVRIMFVSCGLDAAVSVSCRSTLSRRLSLRINRARWPWQTTRISVSGKAFARRRRATARDIRGRLRDIDRRLADIESYVTTENRSLTREIEQLR